MIDALTNTWDKIAETLRPKKAAPTSVSPKVETVSYRPKEVIHDKASWFTIHSGQVPDCCLVSWDVWYALLDETGESGRTTVDGQTVNIPVIVYGMVVLPCGMVGPNYISPMYGLSL